MQCRFSEFRYKEVINIRSGTRLGYVSDAEIQYPEGMIRALIIPGRPRYLGLFGREDDYILPWECISRIGGDIILVESDKGIRRGRREKKPLF